MKKLLITLCAILISNITLAQSVFDKFEDNDEVTTVVLNQRMFKMLASFDIDLDDPEDQKTLDAIKKVKSIKIFSTGNSQIASEMKTSVNKHIKSSKLDELMRIKDGDINVKFYVLEGKDEFHVKELLMYMTGLKEITKGEIEVNGKKRDVEAVIITLTGDIDLREVAKMTESIDMPGGEQLKKATKSKK